MSLIRRLGAIALFVPALALITAASALIEHADPDLLGPTGPGEG